MNSIKYGSRGALVEALQSALIRSGYLSDSPDGIFGVKTLEALKSFQRAFGIYDSGIVDSFTLPFVERFLQGFYIKEIRKGDTLWKISIDNGINLNSLLTANPTIDPENLRTGEKIIVPFSYEIVPTDISYSYFLTSSIIKGLKARYPFITTKTIGHSVMGAAIEALVVGNGNKHIFINSGFHANEWLNVPCILKFTEDYLKAVSDYKPIESADSRYLYENTVLHIVPLVNPDGTDLVTGALYEGAYYEQAKKIAANYHSLQFPSVWKANINGVDLNLQFPASWEKAKEIKFSQGFTMPSPIEYVGKAPLSEPESEAIYRYTNDNDFKLILAYHSQGEIIYWKYLDFLPPESERIGNILSIASGYPLEITPPDSSYAGYKDWFIEAYNRPGYTIETGKGTNPLPISQLKNIYKANKPLIIKAIEETAAL